MNKSTNNQSLPVQPKTAIVDPSPQELRKFTEAMANCRKTACGNVNVQTRVDSRSKRSTYIVSDHPERFSGQTISVQEGKRVSALQDAYIRNQECVVINGWIGNDPEFRTSARLIIEKSNANIAGMQQILFYPPTQEELANFNPVLTVIYTPNLKAEGYPDDRLIAVDLSTNTTRVFNSDYFGESKKGGLRMWNTLVYERGGLSMHAGCKVIPVRGKDKVFLIVGLSGTGKTTTTFTKQNNSGPVQDDFIAWMPNGKVFATENGCFAKTFGLAQESEPTIHKAVTSPNAYLENVYQNESGELDFFNTSYTHNGRAVIRMQDIEGTYDARKLNRPDVLLILNKNENCIPAVAKLNRLQAAAYFMLGETKGTSAGGKDEAGKFLRIPGTNPFFPPSHALQGNRFLELLDKNPMEVYLMNTGRVGGGDNNPQSKKVSIAHSSAIVKAVAEGTIQWTTCPDFQYQVAAHVPGVEEKDIDILQPRLLYKSQGREKEYGDVVKQLKVDRIAYIAQYPALNKDVAQVLR